MSVTIYEYPKCSTCRNAVKWLDAHEVQAERVHILDAPPTKEQLAKLVELSGLELKKFFNTSGEVYKEMKLKDKLGSMTTDEQLELLASNGWLLKRPLATNGSKVTLSFKPEQYEEVWGKE